MLTWLKRVTNFRSHAKGHTILCDVYYQPTNDWSDERFSKSKSFIVCDEFLFHLPPDWSKNSCNSCFDALGLSIHGRIRTQLLSKRTFVFWLKIIYFVTQNDAKEVGNNFPCRKNVTCYKQWWVILSCKTFLFSLTTVRKPSNLHKFPNSIALTACFGVRMIFDFQS